MLQETKAIVKIKAQNKAQSVYFLVMMSLFLDNGMVVVILSEMVIISSLLPLIR